MIGVLLGLVLGCGLVMVASVFTGVPRIHSPTPRWWLAWSDLVVRSGIAGLTPGRLLGLSVVIAVTCGIAVWLWTGVWSVAVAISVVVAPLGQIVVSSRARARQRIMRRAWPDVVDSLVAGVRAGAGLPDLLCDMATSGPAPLRNQFHAFAVDYRANGHFAQALDRLKVLCADPVADRIVEALRLAREIGGADLSTLLRDLGTLLREDARTRGELEARQSWTVNAARLAVAAPWIVLVMVSTQPGAAAAWNGPQGILILVGGAALCVFAYLLMQFLGRLPTDGRTLR